MIFVTADGMPPQKRDVVQYSKAGAPKRISHLSPFVDPMSYPLLYWGFQSRSFGWRLNMRHADEHMSAGQKRTLLTQEQYYSHYLMRRDDNPLPHGAGRLFQQWLVDAYCKTESSRLHWVREHQSTLRAAKYKVVQEAQRERERERWVGEREGG